MEESSLSCHERYHCQLVTETYARLAVSLGFRSRRTFINTDLHCIHDRNSIVPSSILILSSSPTDQLEEQVEGWVYPCLILKSITLGETHSWETRSSQRQHER